MTKSSAAPRVAAYFHELGQEVDLETHVVTIEELAKAPFDVYIAEQQLGDLILVPPRSCHQVVNKGGITIKTSWSRMSLSGLQTALWHELPIYHRSEFRSHGNQTRVDSSCTQSVQTGNIQSQIQHIPCIATLH